MKKVIRVIVGFMLCMVLIGILPNQIKASTGINVEYHTQDEIKQMAENLDIQKEQTVGYSEEPIQKPPYSLGKLDDSTLKNGLDTLNLIRYIAGIPHNVQINSSYERVAQAATVVNWANGVMTHYPTKPDGMDEELYKLGAVGASKSNLGMGYQNLYEAIVNGWMSDEHSKNIDRLGHRRWCLNPGMDYTGFGVTRGNYAMYAVDGSSVDKGYYGIVWPAQNMPLEFFEKSYWYGTKPWSISMGRIVDLGSIHVTLTRKNDGRVWNFSVAGSDGDFYVNNDRYGQKGCIIFRPSGIDRYEDNDRFQVEITGSDLNVSYEVNFFSMHKHSGGEATCQERAICSICGKQYGELGTHRYVSYIKKQPTCTKTGLKCKRCSICRIEDKKSYEDIPLKGHIWEKWIVKKAATYNSEGLKTRKCIKCSAVENIIIDKLQKPVEKPGVPKLDKVISDGFDRLKLSWKKVQGADGYRIYVRNEKGWKVLADVKGSVNFYLHKGLICGKNYTYTVRAFKNTKPKKTYGNYDKYGITGKSILLTPSIGNLKVYDTCIKVNWKLVPGATGYLVYRKTNSGKWTRIATIKNSTVKEYRDLKVKKGNKYTYTVKAYRIQNGKKVYSSYNKTGITVKK